MRSTSSSSCQPCCAITSITNIALATTFLLLTNLMTPSSALTPPNDIIVITHAAGRMGKLLALQIHEESKLCGSTPPTIRAVVRSDAEALSVKCDLGGTLTAGGETRPIPLSWLETVVVKDITDDGDLEVLRMAFSGAEEAILCDASHNEIVWNDTDDTDDTDSQAQYSIIVPAAESKDLSERLLAEITAAATPSSSIKHVILRSSMGLAVGPSTEAGRAMGGPSALNGPARAETLLRATSLDYTILRLGALTDDAGMVPLMFGTNDSLLKRKMDSEEAVRRPPIVSRADAARITGVLLRERGCFRGLTIDCSWHPKFGRNSVGTEEAMQAAGRQDLKRQILDKCALKEQIR